MSEATSSDTKRFRDEHPSGWLVLARHDSVPYIIDALLDAPAHRGFNQSELAREAGVSRQSVGRHVDLLVGIGVLEPIENTTPTRYRFNPDSRVSQALVELDGAMNAAGAEPEG